MKVRVKKLDDKATIPKKAHESDSGYDLVATSRTTDKYGNIVYGTGLAIQVEEGYESQIYPRSSISKKKLHLVNSIGLIDQNYRGELLLKFKPTTSGVGVYEEGDKIAQLVFKKRLDVELVEVEDLDETDRGSGAFGSSDLTKLPKISINEAGLVEGLDK